MAVHVVASMEELESLSEGKTCIVDFHATWCGPCKMIAPTFEELAKEFTNVKALKVDVDELEDIAMKYEISAMPTFLVIKDGKKVDALMGADKDKLRALFQKSN